MARGKKQRRSRVPTGRLERLARIGLLAGEIAAGGVAEGVRRLAGGDASGSLLVTQANAERLTHRLSGMRGAAMKLGQLLSMEGEDLLPPEVASALLMLRADADAMPPSQLRRVLGRAWGKGWEGRFREFDWEPIAAASIGQVHRAVAADGRELALKIQYPGVSRSIASDVDNLAATLRISRILPRDVDLRELIAEVKRQLRQEVDYRIEAEHLRRYGALLADEPCFRVPGVVKEFTTTRVLAMERLIGLPIEDLRGPDHPRERRDRVGAALFQLLLRELFGYRFVQTDPNLANYLWLPESQQVGLVDLGAAREIPERLARLYAQLCRAALRGDRRELGRAAEEMGFLPPGEPSERREALIDFVELTCEPFATGSSYDFAASDLPARVREAATRLAFRHGFRKPPPPETLFVQRKLGGTFLQCARLGACFGARAILEDELARLPDAA
ncbi:MAG: AarF/ABC1/UbiB kinase family protein [Myxococcota bacterium]|nr:AarF/ABC1/UbiB kinase family protein [bacterium]MDP6076070.1 AarF/ABC1/UbiB kinase family protein [Myxococcota bacterium]MDP6244508.1 AarF/ABC1/UbiB kinase family protein [Myxococcota bacterium]MDP7073582.1 AarF/ABC1/UbiB kinase family protein [Myxococcota bacterium]MDP7300738.1 AarF/ABC1/UbiB kinase family protein [Myxococcota bacterium]